MSSYGQFADLGDQCERRDHAEAEAELCTEQVIEVLRAMPEHPSNLVQAVDFTLLHPLELHALGRHITSLPPHQHATPVWRDLARQVSHP